MTAFMPEYTKHVEGLHQQLKAVDWDLEYTKD